MAWIMGNQDDGVRAKTPPRRARGDPGGTGTTVSGGRDARQT